MEYEDRSIPEQNSSDTPEFIRECLRYKRIIEQQLDDWVELSRNRHPAVRIGGIAQIIAANCTPKEFSDITVDTNPFEMRMTPDEMGRLKEKREQQELIAKIAHNPAFDPMLSLEIDADETALEAFFAQMKHFTQNPNSPQASVDAVIYLNRMYNAELFASQHTEQILRANPQSHKFSLLLNRILDDLY